ncbi:MAG: DUF222 domain-containing protein [Nocardioidaceae bacterium]|nr:DUF222 domain-containing protein [Nocardioidaceae bacterium]
MTSTQTLDATAVLAAVRRDRAEADAAEARILAGALAWAQLHEVSEDDVYAAWGDSPLPLAGEGAPLVSEFCLHELATALGLSSERGRHLVAHALELCHRLPRVWARVQGGSLQAWRAERIADKTILLSPEAAAYVDAQIAPYAHRVSLGQVDRLIDQAIAAFMPQTALEIAARAADGRHLTIDHQQISFHGTSLIHGELDLADALDLDKALQAGAEQLKAFGSEESLDVRRSLALGHLARGDQPLDLPAPTREVVLYVHVPHEALNNNGITHVESPNQLLTTEQIARWCRAPETRITIKPVIDLNVPLETLAYQPTDRIREHVILRDRTCAFPRCTKNARRADLDHIVEWIRGGRTSTLNLAPLCRGHHRAKTFTTWTYQMLEPGRYLWRSPHGYRFLKDHYGTQDLGPPEEPPGP